MSVMCTKVGLSQKIMIKQSVLDNLTKDAFYLIYGSHYEDLRCMAQMSITWWARKMLMAELQMKIVAVGSPWYHDKRIKLEKGENWRKKPFHWLWFKASLYIVLSLYQGITMD